MKKYEAHIVGTGRIAGYLEDDPLRDHPCTHAGVYSRMKEIKLVSCLGRNKEKAKNFADKFSVPHYYDDFDELIRYHSPDIMSICTPAEYHPYYIVRAAESRKVRAVFCEKAIANSLEEADNAVESCRKNNVLLVVNYLRRWGGEWRVCKSLIENGAIGNIQSVIGYFSGHIVHTGTHLFDLLLFLFGKPLWVKGRIKAFGEVKAVSGYKFDNSEKFDDPGAFALFGFENDIVAVVNGFEKDYFIFELDIIGTKGRIRIGNFLKELWVAGKSPHYIDFYELVKRDFPELKNSKNAWFSAVENIVNALEKKENPFILPHEAVMSLEMAVGIIVSSSYNSSKIRFPISERSLKISSK